VILVGFDLTHEFPAHRWVVAQLADCLPSREGFAWGDSYPAILTLAYFTLNQKGTLFGVAGIQAFDAVNPT
jgi:hypothetical protein